MNNSPVKSELYVALEMVELTQFLPFTKLSIQSFFQQIITKIFKFFKQSSNYGTMIFYSVDIQKNRYIF